MRDKFKRLKSNVEKERKPVDEIWNDFMDIEAFIKNRNAKFDLQIGHHYIAKTLKDVENLIFTFGPKLKAVYNSKTINEKIPTPESDNSTKSDSKVQTTEAAIESNKLNSNITQIQLEETITLTKTDIFLIVAICLILAIFIWWIISKMYTRHLKRNKPEGKQFY